MSSLVFDVPHGVSLSLDIDRRSIKYTGKGSARNAASAQTSQPLCHESMLNSSSHTVSNTTTKQVYYYEIDIKNGGEIVLGFAYKSFRLTSLLGTTPYGLGLNGNTGKVTCNHLVLSSQTCKYTSAHVVGCGYDSIKKCIFFTKNGNVTITISLVEFLRLSTPNASLSSFDHTSIAKITGKLYPTVSMHSSDASLRANFGQEPFEFDIQAYIHAQEAQYNAQIQTQTISQDIMFPLLLDYMHHRGYARTYDALLSTQQQQQQQQQEAEEKIEMKKEVDNVFRHHRAHVQTLVMTQNYIELCQYLDLHYGVGFWQHDDIISFQIHILKFLTMWKQAVSPETRAEAVIYAQTYMTNDVCKDQDQRMIRDELMTCIAFPDMNDAPAYIQRFNSVTYTKQIAQSINQRLLTWEHSQYDHVDQEHVHKEEHVNKSADDGDALSKKSSYNNNNNDNSSSQRSILELIALQRATIATITCTPHTSASS